MKRILIKPIFTEKSEKLSDGLGQVSFVVNKRANKVEIRKAIEKKYKVGVQSVNTLIMPSKTKSKSTKAGLVKGRKSGFKKAVITLKNGEEIDFFGEI